MALTVGELVGYLKLDDSRWNTVMARAHKTLQGMAGRLQTAGAHVGRLSMGMVKLAVTAGAAASTLTHLVNVLGGAGSGMFAMGTAAVGVAAAGIATMIAVTQTLKLGTAGLGDAMKAIASGDAAKYQEALQKLSPAGREFAESIRKLKPAFDSLKLDVQQHLLQGLGAEVQKTATAFLPLMREQFTSLATVLNLTAKEVLGVARSGENLSTLHGTVINITRGFNFATQAAAPLTQAMIDIVNAGSAGLPRVGTALRDVAEHFAAFVHAKQQSGDLAKAFDAGMTKIAEFGRMVRDFGVGVANVFRIGAQQGESFGGTLSRVAASFRRFTESADGRAVLGDVFSLIHMLSDAFGTFMSALRPLLPVIGDFAKVLGDQLAKILVELGPVIADVGKVLIDALADVLPELVPFIIDLAKGFGQILKAAAPLIKPLADILVALTPLIGPIVRLAEQLFPVLARLLEDLAPLVKGLADVFGFLIDAVGKVVDVIDKAISGLETLMRPLDIVRKAILILTGHADLLGGHMEAGIGKVVKGAQVAGGSAPAYAAAGGKIVDALTGGVEAGKVGFWNRVSTMLDGLLPKYGVAATAADTSGKDIARALAGGVEAEQGLAWERIGLILDGFVSLIDGSGPRFNEKGRNLTKLFSDGFTAEQQDAWNRAISLVTGIESILSGRSAAFAEKGRALAKLFGDGLSQGASGVYSTASGIANRIPGFFESISLYSQGAAITSSLERGINSRVGFLKGLLNSITNFIPSWKGPAERDAQLLTPAGVSIMQGLQAGIQSQIPGLRGLLGGVTSDIPGMAGVGGMVGGGQAGSRPVVELRIGGDGSDLATAILPGLQKTVRTSGGVTVVFGK
jgi:phage-related protein